MPSTTLTRRPGGSRARAAGRAVLLGLVQEELLELVEDEHEIAPGRGPGVGGRGGRGRVAGSPLNVSVKALRDCVLDRRRVATGAEVGDGRGSVSESSARRTTGRSSDDPTRRASAVIGMRARGGDDLRVTPKKRSARARCRRRRQPVGRTKRLCDDVPWPRCCAPVRRTRERARARPTRAPRTLARSPRRRLNGQER